MWICKKCNYSNGNSVVACIKCQFAEEEASKNKISSNVSDVTVVDEEKSSVNKWRNLLIAFTVLSILLSIIHPLHENTDANSGVILKAMGLEYGDFNTLFASYSNTVKGWFNMGYGENLHLHYSK